MPTSQNRVFRNREQTVNTVLLYVDVWNPAR